MHGAPQTVAIRDRALRADEPPGFETGPLSAGVARVSWQARIYERFRAAPDEWISLGELFEEVKLDIPLHYATRHALRVQAPNSPMVSGDKAQWLFFTQVVSKIGVERLGEGRFWAYGNRVRLRHVVGRLCEKCAGPVVKSAWSSKHTVVCVHNCEVRQAEAPTPVAPVAAAPLPMPKPFNMQLVLRHVHRNIARMVKEHCPMLSLNEIERQLKRWAPHVLIARYR